jgi:putative membrane protein
MKKVFLFSKAILAAGVVVLSLGSCKNESKQEDPKEVAEDQNDVKFDDNNAKEDDSEFLVDAAEINLAEIEIGKLAQQKGTHPEVKKFGKMLVDDHQKLSNEVKSLADSRNFSVPLSLTEDGKEEYNKLNKETGTDFDKKFINVIIDEHEDAIDKFSKAADKANDEEIKAWASKNVSSLTAHLQQAKLLKETLDKK